MMTQFKSTTDALKRVDEMIDDVRGLEGYIQRVSTQALDIRRTKECMYTLSLIQQAFETHSVDSSEVNELYAKVYVAYKELERIGESYDYDKDSTPMYTSDEQVNLSLEVAGRIAFDILIAFRMHSETVPPDVMNRASKIHSAIQDSYTGFLIASINEQWDLKSHHRKVVEDGLEAMAQSAEDQEVLDGYMRYRVREQQREMGYAKQDAASMDIHQLADHINLLVDQLGEKQLMLEEQGDDIPEAVEGMVTANETLMETRAEMKKDNPDIKVLRKNRDKVIFIIRFVM